MSDVTNDEQANWSTTKSGFIYTYIHLFFKVNLKKSYVAQKVNAW